MPRLTSDARGLVKDWNSWDPQMGGSGIGWDLSILKKGAEIWAISIIKKTRRMLSVLSVKLFIQEFTNAPPDKWCRGLVKDWDCLELQMGASGKERNLWFQEYINAPPDKWSQGPCKRLKQLGSTNGGLGDRTGSINFEKRCKDMSSFDNFKKAPKAYCAFCEAFNSRIN